MWHFGHCQDVLSSYSGEKFDMNWEDSLNVFHHVYPKGHEGKSGKKKTMNIRDEVQEYPNKPLKEAFMDKIRDESNNKS
jgi:hypothetical protein